MRFETILFFIFIAAILVACFLLMKKTKAGIITYFALFILFSSTLLYYNQYLHNTHMHRYKEYYERQAMQKYSKPSVFDGLNGLGSPHFMDGISQLMLAAFFLFLFILISVIWYFVQRSYSKWQVQNKNK